MLVGSRLGGERLTPGALSRRPFSSAYLDEQVYSLNPFADDLRQIIESAIERLPAVLESHSQAFYVCAWQWRNRDLSKQLEH